MACSQVRQRPNDLVTQREAGPCVELGRWALHVAQPDSEPGNTVKAFASPRPMSSKNIAPTLAHHGRCSHSGGKIQANDQLFRSTVPLAGVTENYPSCGRMRISCGLQDELATENRSASERRKYKRPCKRYTVNRSISHQHRGDLSDYAQRCRFQTAAGARYGSKVQF